MHVNSFGDRQARVPHGWVKEPLVGVPTAVAIRVNAYGALCDLKVVEHPG